MVLDIFEINDGGVSVAYAEKRYPICARPTMSFSPGSRLVEMCRSPKEILLSSGAIVPRLPIVDG
jgi:hypothetical protein